MAVTPLFQTCPHIPGKIYGNPVVTKVNYCKICHILADEHSYQNWLWRVAKHYFWTGLVLITGTTHNTHLKEDKRHAKLDWQPENLSCSHTTH